MIETKDLGMTYRVAAREPGVMGAVKSLFSRKYNEVVALSGVSVSIPTGQVVGLIGPNGAGKTTLLKILSGIMPPGRGEVSVLGHRPFDHRNEFKRGIALIMGQRNQLIWDVSALESFRLTQAIYEIPDAAYKSALDALSAMLGVTERLRTPVRQLSLGERTKMNIICGLLYSPRVLFLDEPTIGLDLKSQLSIRAFIRDYAANRSVTVLLTSHAIADIEETCGRVLLIHKGGILHDGSIGDLKRRASPKKFISFTASEDAAALLSEYVVGTTQSGDATTVEVHADDVTAVFERMVTHKGFQNITIEDTPIESIILDVFDHA